MSVEREELGSRLRGHREYFGYTQAEVAESLGISRSAIVHIEQGTRRVDAQELRKLATLYGCTVSFLVEDEEEANEDIEMVARAAQGLSKEDQQEILRFAQFLRSRSNRE